MRLSLIITTYNWPSSLELVLKSVEIQTILPDEVIIADDGSKSETKKLIEDYKLRSELNLLHSWQKDKGFRAARSRNKAILKSNGDYIVLIDGDMILNKRFVEDHKRNAENGYFIQGSRVLLGKKKTKQILNTKKIDISFFSLGLTNRKNAIQSNFMSRIFLSRKNYLHGIKSCNMSFFKKDCLKVNGFNNEIEGWGREDSEFVVRLMKSGLVRKNIKFNAIQFHLYHPENNRTTLDKNDLILNKAIKNSSYFCENGINSLI